MRLPCPLRRLHTEAMEALRLDDVHHAHLAPLALHPRADPQERTGEQRARQPPRQTIGEGHLRFGPFGTKTEQAAQRSILSERRQHKYGIEIVARRLITSLLCRAKPLIA